MPLDRDTRDRASLLDVLNHALLAREFIAGYTRDTFFKDSKTKSSVSHEIIVIGEATKRISTGFRERHPELPWKQMAGMRDVMVHEYDEVDLDVVWTAAAEHLPAVITEARRVLGIE